VNALQRSAVIVGYELRRAIAKKWVLALLILALAIQILPFIFLSRLAEFEIINETMWVIGVLSGQSLFVHLIAILVAGGSMSEEYEHGTADILLSKPITRVEYMTGKFLGGFLLVSFVEVVTTVMGVILAFTFFGPQRDLHFVPLMFVAIVYSTLLFFSITFMFSEVLRRSTLSILMGFGIFIVSLIVGNVLSNLYSFTREQIYMDVNKLLPTWSATTLPSSLATDLKIIPLTGNGMINLPSGDVHLATIIVAIYTVIFVLLAYFRLVRSDVTKRAD